MRIEKIKIKKWHWHPWFAWHPVTIYDGILSGGNVFTKTIIWWEDVERKQTIDQSGSYYDYRLINDND